MKKIILLSILSISFAAMGGIQSQPKLNEQAQKKFDAIQRCKEKHCNNGKTPMSLIYLIDKILRKNPPTYLQKATTMGDTECVEVFLNELGTDVNSYDDNGMTALHIAAKTGDFDTINILLKHGANVNIRSKKDGTVPLHYTVFSNCPNIVALFNKSNAEMNALDSNGQTALHRCVSYLESPVFYIDKSQCAGAMIKNGVDPNIPDSKGNTALHLAGYSKIAIELIKGDAKVRVLNILGQTPLHLAIMNRRAGVVKALLEHGAGADISTQDSYGRTPEEWLKYDPVFTYLPLIYRSKDIKKIDATIRAMLEREESRT